MNVLLEVRGGHERRWKRYLAYRDSGVAWLGEVPEGWKIEKCKFVFREVNDRSTDGSECLLSVSEYYGVAPRSEHIEEGDHLTRAETLVGYKKCLADDLAINIMLSWKRGLGICPVDGIISPSYSVFRCIRDDCAPWYLHHLLRTDLYTSNFKSRSTGIIDSRLRMYPDAFGQVETLLPPRPEQRAIAAFLDRETAKIDVLAAKKERLVELFEEKRTALISHVVTKGLDPDAPMKDSGIEWLGEVPAHWKVKRIKQLVRVVRGKFTHRPRNDPRLYDGSYPFVQTGDIAAANKFINSYQQTLNEFGFAVSKLFPSGTLVMTIAANIGDLAILEFPACFPDSIVGFIPVQEVCLDYLYFNLTAMNQQMFETATINTQFNLNIERIGALYTVYLPINEQRAIAAFLDRETAKIDALTKKIYEQIEKLKEYRTALISAAVTGKIDVRGEIP